MKLFLYRRTRFRIIPWIAWNSASYYFRAGWCVSWLGLEIQRSYGPFAEPDETHRDGEEGTVDRLNEAPRCCGHPMDKLLISIPWWGCTWCGTNYRADLTLRD